MTKGTRKWLTGLMKAIFWLCVGGVTLTSTIECFNNGSWWCIFYGLGCLGAINAAVDASELISDSHNEE
jgi:hypothetical protein